MRAKAAAFVLVTPCPQEIKFKRTVTPDVREAMTYYTRWVRTYCVLCFELL